MINTRRILWLTELSHPARKLLMALVGQANQNCKARYFKRYRDNWQNLDLSEAFTLLNLSPVEALTLTKELEESGLIDMNGTRQCHVDFGLLREFISIEWQGRIKVKRLNREFTRAMNNLEYVASGAADSDLIYENGMPVGVRTR